MSLARAFVDISPDTTAFPEELKAKVEAAAKRVQAKVNIKAEVHLEQSVLQQQLAKMRAEFASGGGVDLGLAGQIQSVEGTLASLGKKAADETENAFSQMAGKLPGMLGTSLSGLAENPQMAAAAAGVGLVLASGISAALSGATVAAGASVGLAAGIALAARSPAVKNAFGELGRGALADLSDAASVFQGPLVQAAGVFKDAFATVLPDIKRDFAELAPLVVPLAQGLGQALVAVQPGIHDMVEAAKPIMVMIAEELPKISQAVGDFFSDISQGRGGLDALQLTLSLLEVSLEVLGRTLETLNALFELFGGGITAAALKTKGLQQLIAFLAGPLAGLADMFNKSTKAATDAAGGADKFKTHLDAVGPSAQAAQDAIGAVTKAMGEMTSQQDAASGIAKALFAATVDRAEAAAKAGDAVAAASNSLADMVRNNATALAEARKNYDQTLVSNSRSIQSAQDAVAAALRGVTSANAGLTRSQREELDAQKNLTAARQTALDQLKSYRQQVRDIADTEEEARIRLAEAQQQVLQTSGLPANNLDRRKALVAADEAQHNLDDVLSNAAETRRKAAAAEAKGVEGSDVVVAAQQRLADSHASVGTAAQGVADANKRVAQSRQELADAQTRAADSETAAHKRLTDAQAANTTTLVGNSGAALRNRAAIEGQIDAAKQKYIADLNNKSTMESAWPTYEATLQKIKDQAGALGFDTTQVQGLITQYGTLNQFGTIETFIKMTGADTAKAQIDALFGSVQQFAALFGVSLSSVVSGLSGGPGSGTYNSQVPYGARTGGTVNAGGWGGGGIAPPSAWAPGGPSLLPGHATGGPIAGEGTGRSDSNLIWASKGEHMWTAEEVAAAGGHAGVEALRRMVLGKYATGGAVGGRVIPELDISAAVGSIANRLTGPVYAEMARLAGGPVSAGGGTGGGGQTVSSVQSWLRGVDPLPYIRGEVGPSAYDCSGLVGEVWARLTGNPDYRRYFVTGNERQFLAAHGFRDGTGTFTVGFSGEHTMGNLGGLNFEAANSRSGIHVGSGTSDVRSFPNVMYLPQFGSSFVGSGGMALDPNSVRLGGVFGNVLRAIGARSEALAALGFGGGGDAGATGDADVARIAASVGRAMGADRKVMLALFEAGLVESGMRNLTSAVDHDSLGYLQQRPSMGWPDPTNVATATRSFLSRAMANEGRYATAGQLAQSVQRSAFPDRYDARQRQAGVLLGEYGFDRGGWLPPGPWNGTGKPEAVLDPAESAGLKAAVQQGPVELGADTIRRLVVGIVQGLQTRPHTTQIDGRAVTDAVQPHLSGSFDLAGLVQ